jgi:hypothetical protein
MVPSLSDRAPGANPSHDASSGPDVKSTSRRTAFALACGCWFFGHLMRPAPTHRSAHRVDLAGRPSQPAGRQRIRQARVVAPVPRQDADGERCRDRRTQPAPTVRSASADEHPVQHLTPKGADPSLRVGIRPWRPHRSAQHLDLFSGKDRIECGGPPRQARPATPVPVAPAAPDESRCQRSSVAGCTNNPGQVRRGSSRASPASTARSAQSTSGRATRRPSTATSWRTPSSSASLAAALRDSSASQLTTWQNSSYSSRRVMRRSSRPGNPRANSQLSTYDRVSGTHRCGADAFRHRPRRRVRRVSAARCSPCRSARRPAGLRGANRSPSDRWRSPGCRCTAGRWSPSGRCRCCSAGRSRRTRPPVRSSGCPSRG